MKLHLIETGWFKLDGGAMFGVVPHKLWSQMIPPDDNNMCTWTMRCLLLEDGARKILIDTGMGDKQDDKFRSHFEPHGPYTLSGSLDRVGVHPNEITDVFLTHLHFDHCGGALVRSASGDVVPQFPNATYWTNKRHLDWALNPNFREKASFLKENIVPLKDQNKLAYIDVKDGVHFTDSITVDFYNGHTESMMVPTIHLGGKQIVFPTDLLASAHHVRMPYVMGYDIRPLVTLEEKARFYEKSHDPNTYFIFEHDKDMAMGQLVRNDRGRYSIKEVDAEVVLS